MNTIFAPEDPLYIQGIVYSQALLVWFAFLLLLVFLIFIFGRLFFNKCDASIERDEGYSRSQRPSYLCGIWLLGLLLISSVSITMIGNVGSLEASLSS